MLIDGQALDDGAELVAEVAVVGAGPAGISLALELARAGHDVILVESGRRHFSPEIQQLSEPASFDPRVHAPMAEATRRQIGGASVTWGGRCLPYDPVDFDERPWIPNASWPLRYEAVQPFFDRAAQWFFCGTGEFDARRIPGVRQPSIVPGLPDGDVLTSTRERWSLPTNFGREYWKEIRASRTLRLVHGLSCTEIACDASGRRADALVVRSLAGRTIRVRARASVLACGGLETTRLLLASDHVHPGGIGNHADLLGRFYMGHVSGRIARVCFSTPAGATTFGFERDADGVYLRPRFTFSREFLARERLPNIEASLVNPDIWDASHGSGVLSFAYLALTSALGPRFASDAILKAATGDRPRVVAPHLRNMLRDLPRTAAFIASFGVRRFLLWRRIPGFFTWSAANVYPLHYHAEQMPNPESRVTLAGERDATGLRRLRIDLRFGADDVDGVVRAHHHWDAWLQRHRCGHLEYRDGDRAAAVAEQARDGFHQIGTTRMSARPEDGVVDPNLRVHGLENLYVASSSVFVTSGQANPTFTIVAFALRLADHLREHALR